MRKELSYAQSPLHVVAFFAAGDAVGYCVIPIRVDLVYTVVYVEARLGLVSHLLGGGCSTIVTIRTCQVAELIDIEAEFEFLQPCPFLVGQEQEIECHLIGVWAASLADAVVAIAPATHDWLALPNQMVRWNFFFIPALAFNEPFVVARPILASNANDDQSSKGLSGEV